MKTCTKCGKPESEVEFGTYKRGLRLRHCCVCKTCQRIGYRAHDLKRREQKRAYSKEYYHSNKSYFQNYYTTNKASINRKVADINRASRQKRYIKIQALKKAALCMDCGANFPHYVLDYDHRDPATKVANVSGLMRCSVSWKRVEGEIAKCDIVCARCHRLRTYKGRTKPTTLRYRYHRLAVDELKSSTPCLDCGGRFAPAQMDFDHVQPETKLATVACLMRGPLAELKAEIAKCQLVCANCHRVRGHTGVRPETSNQDLNGRLDEILERTRSPTSARLRPFPVPLLLGVLTDQLLSELSGMSKAMVGYHRRRRDALIRLET